MAKERYKRVLIIIISIVLILSIVGCNNNKTDSTNKPTDYDNDSFDFVKKNDIKYRFKAEGNYFHIYKNGQWKKTFFKGVNIGAGKPGLFPGELSIGYEDYYRWFQLISEMGANCIRIYTAHRPQFYNALYDFNKNSENPIYFFQGVWMNEEDISSLGDVYAQNGKIMNEFINDAKDLVDIIHGNITLPKRSGYASGTYTADVSKYLAGWMLGIEWDPTFVSKTNNSNPDRSVYDGSYLYTINASPFEAFLCQAGDQVVKYQTEKYKFQVPLSFINWVTTDPLSHPYEPHPDEDLVSVNMENIKTRDIFLPDQFLSYNVYPYYPDSLNYQKDYVSYVDKTGKNNPYEAYLIDLKMAHTKPVIIGEFGIPTSRGLAHKSIVLDYNQGYIDEIEQGDVLIDMMYSIYNSSYAGALIFTWQDEWFKRTWNNVKFDVADKRPFWSNAQTNEQAFGILSFDPGIDKSICYVDGDISDWKDNKPLLSNSDGNLYMKSDERYVYFMINFSKNFDFMKSKLIIPIDIIDNQGNHKMNTENVLFDRAADFVIQVNGKDNTRIVVDSYYDSFYFLYGEQYQMIDKVKDIRVKNSGRFNPINLCYNYKMTVPIDNIIVPFSSYETGKLKFGIANPSSENYESLADFYFKDNVLEIKIPWQLLNVADPSGKKILNDMYVFQGFLPIDCNGIWVGMGIKNDSGQTNITIDKKYDWKEWTVPTWHERLKPAYYVLQKEFGKFQ